MVSTCQSQLTESRPQAQGALPKHIQRPHDARLNRDLDLIEEHLRRGELQELGAMAREIARRAHYLRYALRDRGLQDATAQAHKG